MKSLLSIVQIAKMSNEEAFILALSLVNSVCNKDLLTTEKKNNYLFQKPFV